MLKEAGKDSLLRDGPHLRAGEEHQEGEAPSTNCCELTATHQVESCKMGRGGGSGFRFTLISPHPSLILIGIH